MITRRLCSAARAALDMSVTDLAEAAGVSVPTIHRWERGDADIMSISARQIEEALAARGIKFIRTEEGSLGITYPKALDDKDIKRMHAMKTNELEEELLEKADKVEGDLRGPYRIARNNMIQRWAKDERPISEFFREMLQHKTYEDYLSSVGVKRVEHRGPRRTRNLTGRSVMIYARDRGWIADGRIDD